MFSVGERVQIIAPGWAWDGKIGEVKSATPANELHEPGYIVLVKWLSPDCPRRYNLWQSQLQAAPRESEAT